MSKKKALPENMTVVVSCSCRHNYQDEKYGKGKRVKNRSLKDTDIMICTVCNRKGST